MLKVLVPVSMSTGLISVPGYRIYFGKDGDRLRDIARWRSTKKGQDAHIAAAKRALARL